MSKKLAGGADAIVLDVKTGNGAFMKDFENAKKLAEAMVAIGKEVGRDTAAYITDMNQPLGQAVGNALEVKEAIRTLKGKGPADLTELCVELGAGMLQLAGKVSSLDQGKELLRTKLKNGEALAKFGELITAQGGSAKVIKDLSLLPTAENKVEVKAEKSGYVSAIKALDVGLAAMILGAGRENKDSKIDLAVGLELKQKIADSVEKGDTLAVLHYNDSANLEEAKAKLLAAFTITKEKKNKNKLLYEIIK